MKKDLTFYALLTVLTITDAWLLAHPNLIGRMGILFYKYSMLKTFPRSLATVSLTLITCLTISYFMQNKFPRRQSLWAMAILTLACVGLFIQTYFKFSTGSYALTGAGFKTGAVLLPALLTLIFGKGLYEILQKAQ